MQNICWLLGEGISGTGAGEGLELTERAQCEHLSGPTQAPSCLHWEAGTLQYFLTSTSFPPSLPVPWATPPLSTRPHIQLPSPYLTLVTHPLWPFGGLVAWVPEQAGQDLGLQSHSQKELVSSPLSGCDLTLCPSFLLICLDSSYTQALALQVLVPVPEEQDSRVCPEWIYNKVLRTLREGSSLDGKFTPACLQGRAAEVLQIIFLSSGQSTMAKPWA